MLSSFSFVSDDEHQVTIPTVQASVSKSQEPPKKKKKKTLKVKAGKNSKAKPVSETAESPANSGPLTANWVRKREHDKASMRKGMKPCHRLLYH